jgi:glycosyltransferase involved in cell wall biosynthesis
MPGSPTVTFIICAFNQEKYVRESVLGAFSQTHGPLEIVLSDDCSTDRTFEIMETLAREYTGAHRIRLNRNPKNLGLIAHVNRIPELCSGELMVVAAGDDISQPQRVERLVAAYEQGGRQAGLIHSNVRRFTDTESDLGVFVPPIISARMNLEAVAESDAAYLGATGCWHRKLFDQFGPIRYPNAYEDLVLGFRAALMEAIVYVDEPLVRYRVDAGISTLVARYPRKFGPAISRRKRDVTMLLDVYRQRLADLLHLGDRAKIELLRGRLERMITLHEQRVLFYRNPAALLACTFHRSPRLSWIALYDETRRLVDVARRFAYGKLFLSRSAT